MKRFLYILIGSTLLLLLSACGSTPQKDTSVEVQSEKADLPDPTDSDNTDTSNAAAADQPAERGKILVVYFSLPETASPEGMTAEEENSTVVIDGEVLGNTQYVANVIQVNTGADLFRIEAKTPYTTDHKALVDLAKEEQNSEARPLSLLIPMAAAAFPIPSARLLRLNRMLS